MKRIVIDTNVLVSSAIAKGHSFAVINICVTNIKLITICLSESILLEYNKLVFYKRLIKKYPDFIMGISANIEKLEKTGIFFYPEKYFDILKDRDDNKFLELAYISKADYLITGNHKDFTIAYFEQTKSISPKTFCELYEKDSL